MAHGTVRAAAIAVALALLLPVSAFSQQGFPGATAPGGLEGVPAPQSAPAPPAAPQTRLHLGPLNVDLSLTLGVTYCDNVYATADGTKSDLSFTVTPNLRLWTAQEYENGFTLGVNAQSATAQDYKDLSHIDWEFYARYVTTFKDALKLEIGDTYRPGHITPLESTSGDLEEENSNEAKVALAYDFGNLWVARLAFTNTIFDYPDAKNRARTENMISPALSFKLFRRSSVFLAYDYTDISYDTETTLDNVKHNVSLGMDWEFTEITKGTAEVGFEAVNFKDPAEADWSTWSASVDLRHELNQLTTASVRGEHSIQEGKYAGTRYIITTGLSADLTRQILERLSGTVTAGFFLEDWSDINPGDTEKRSDKSGRLGLELTYAFRTWLDFHAHYDFLKRDSNIDHYDATVNTVTVEATLRF